MTKQEKIIREAIEKGLAAGVKLRYGSFGIDFSSASRVYTHYSAHGVCPIGMCLLGKPIGPMPAFTALSEELGVDQSWIDDFWNGFDHLRGDVGKGEAYDLGWRLRDEYLPPESA